MKTFLYWGAPTPLVKTVKIREPAPKTLHVDVFTVQKIVASNQKTVNEIEVLEEEDLDEDEYDLDDLVGNIPMVNLSDFEFPM